MRFPWQLWLLTWPVTRQPRSIASQAGIVAAASIDGMASELP